MRKLPVPLRTGAVSSVVVLGAAAVALPALSSQALATEDQVAVIAHRGASAQAPENTLAAVDRADQLGVDWVENDVQRTKDGVLVVIHDTDLQRTTNAEQVFPRRSPWKVADFTAAEISRLDAGGWKGEEYAGTRVPTLRDYLRRVDVNDQKLLMEIKAPEQYPGIEDDVLRVLGEERWLNQRHLRNRLVVQSFSTDSIRTLHGARPDVRTGFLGTPSLAALPWYAQFTDQINPKHSTVSAAYVAAVQSFGGPHGRRLEVNTWTVNAAPEARLAARNGVDGIITNTPDVVAEALGQVD
ncbi:glycerophosphodiester phosphodiesterase family protein [Streptomyces sp. NPDC005955]|uniref:glycerophosphodiester phosphodiesterase n=1 Tax=Streptomyces sp. NPDC005955 TaxID=3364738 RepID=UPI0036BA55E7